jgi:hypothetical protein
MMQRDQDPGGLVEQVGDHRMRNVHRTPELLTAEP